MLHPSDQDPGVIQRCGVIFDIDDTLADSSWREDLDFVDPSMLMGDPPIEPVYSLARDWEKHSTNDAPPIQVDVVYLTGRGHALWTPTKLWLSKHKLFGQLICRPTDVTEREVPSWKARTIAELMKKHRWQHVTLYENNVQTLKLTQSKIPEFAFTPALVVADGEKVSPSSKMTGLPEKDILNFQILMGRLAEDAGWKSLLLKKWASRSDLLEAAQDFIHGKENRREFRQMIDRLWQKVN